MTCNFDEMLLYEYLDDLLDADEKVLVNNHLSSCPECRKKMAEIKLLFYEIEHVETIDVPLEAAHIRESIVAEAFEHEVVSPLTKVANGVKKTAVAITPSKEQVGSAVKSVYHGSKKVYQAIPKKEKKPKKVKSFGGLL